MSFKGKHYSQMSAQMTDADFGAGTKTGTVELVTDTTYSDGGTNDADLAVSKKVTIAPAGSDTSTLDDASLLDLLDDAATFATLKEIAIQNTGTGDLSLGGTFNGGMSVSIAASGSFILKLGTGVAVGAGETIVLSSTAGTDFEMLLTGLTA